MLPGIGSAKGRSWDEILRGFHCGWHCFSESFAFSYLLQQQLQQQSSVAVALATPMSVDGSATCGLRAARTMRYCSSATYSSIP